MASTKTAISLDPRLMEEIDEKAESLSLSRSGFLARAAEELLDRLRSREMKRQLDEVYGEAEDAEDRERRQAMLRKQRKLVEGNW